MPTDAVTIARPALAALDPANLERTVITPNINSNLEIAVVPFSMSELLIPAMSLMALVSNRMPADIARIPTPACPAFFPANAIDSIRTESIPNTILNLSMLAVTLSRSRSAMSSKMPINILSPTTKPKIPSPVPNFTKLQANAKAPRTATISAKDKSDLLRLLKLIESMSTKALTSILIATAIPTIVKADLVALSPDSLLRTPIAAPKATAIPPRSIAFFQAVLKSMVSIILRAPARIASAPAKDMKDKDAFAKLPTSLRLPILPIARESSDNIPIRAPKATTV